ncbi:D-2-hydroxyacid dehydrogenase [Neisseria sp. Ec49-e6-T10]|uniref:D-2-hydroxyacid dehydrogenase n=1 Tax=Neisseria sp. Ec49-e6-T10 TaxID=3140744 RepID=UPI003EB779C0
MTNIVFLDRGTLAQANLQFNFPFVLTDHYLCPENEVAKALEGQEIAITNKVKITRQDMLANPQLKMIAVAATGYNHIDVVAAKELGICVCNVSGYSTVSVAEHAFMMMIALMHRLPEYQQKARLDSWSKSPFFCVFGTPFYHLVGKTVGIFGRGEIGSAFARFAQAFNMNVLFAEHKGATSCREGYVDAQTVLAQADVISIHCPLNEHTHHLIDHEEMAQMKEGAIIINVSRGGLVNEEALANALRSGKLGGAGFDVLSAEPPVKSNPLLASDLSNIIVTPHIAWASEESLKNLTDSLIQNINAFKVGKPINQIV